MRATALPVYYGWFVLAASAVSEMLVMGATAYASGLFVLPLQAEFHISRADANSSILILYLGASLTSPLVGKLLDRYPIRLVMTLGAIVLGLSFAGIALAPALDDGCHPALAGGYRFHQSGAAEHLYPGGALVPPPPRPGAGNRGGGPRGGFSWCLCSARDQHYGWRQALLYEGAALAIIIITLALLGCATGRPTWGWKIIPKTRIRMARRPHPSRRRWAGNGLHQPRLLDSQSDFGRRLRHPPGHRGHAGAIRRTAGRCARRRCWFRLSRSRPASPKAAGLLADHINQRLLLISAAAFMTLSWLDPQSVARYGALFASSCLAGIALAALPTAAKLSPQVWARALRQRDGLTCALTLAMAILAVRCGLHV